ncbi:MAG: glycosyltransferase family 2 protein [Alteraurantiacibacter sp.]
MSRIDILLATYNGARFLPEQLASLKEQTHQDWHLLVRDDGSSDATVEIVRDWQKGVQQRVTILEVADKGLGASLNFARLLAPSDAPYFACCDQDDVWLPEKLELMLSAVQSAENENSVHLPCLAYSDLRVVDGALNPISDSYQHFSRRPMLHEGRELRQVMMHNVVTGCASLGNAALRRKALPVPPEASMHDWWLAMVAAGLGELVWVPQATILYRQHGGNTLGANANDPISQLRYLASNAGEALGRCRKLLTDTQLQAGAFVDRYGAQLTGSDRHILLDYAHLPEMGMVSRKQFFLRNKMLKDNIIKNLPFFIIA